MNMINQSVRIKTGQYEGLVGNVVDHRDAGNGEEVQVDIQGVQNNKPVSDKPWYFLENVELV